MEEESLHDPSLSLPLFRAENIATYRRGLRRRSQVGVEKWREKEQEVGRGVGRAGVRMKIDLLRR